jgi:hypothetical protein
MERDDAIMNITRDFTGRTAVVTGAVLPVDGGMWM